MFKTIHHMKYAIAATLVLFATAAQAQTYTTTPMMPQGQMPTPPGMGAYFQALQNPPQMPGGAWTATTVPMGSGMSVTTINPPPQMPALPGVPVPGAPYR